MVVKIQQAAEDIERALVYNGNKMTGPVGILEGEELQQYEEDHAQTGHVLAVVNVPELSDLRNEFSRLKLKNKKNSKGRPLEKPVFHMSVNPGEGDRKLSEREVVEFINELMKQLGYKDNPYAIYKHNDIAREHYHVVGTRIGQDGQKVRDAFENARCNKIIESLAKKYGYTVGTDDGTDLDEEMAKAENENKGQQEPVQPKVEKSSGDDKKQPQKADKATKKDYVPPFDFESDIPRTEQYINAHEDAMKWSFTTIEQYSALMLWRYNIRTKVYNDGIQYNGITKDMHIDAVAVNEKELGIEALKAVIKRSEDCSGNSRNSMKYKRTQKERIEKLSQWAAESSDSWIAYRKLMERKGVYVVLSWNENNEPFGVTYLDRATKCAWKASDTKTDFAWLKDMAEQKGWEFSRHPRFEREEKAEFKASMTSEQMKKASSRKQANRAIRDTGSPSVLETLANKKGVGKTHRSNVDASKNKDRLKKEGEEQNEIII